MSNEQLLQAISDMMDQKLEEKLDKKLDEKLKSRMDKLESQVDNFYLEFKTFETNISKSVHTLQDEMETVIIILKVKYPAAS